MTLAISVLPTEIAALHYSSEPIPQSISAPISATWFRTFKYFYGALSLVQVCGFHKICTDHRIPVQSSTPQFGHRLICSESTLNERQSLSWIPTDVLRFKVSPSIENGSVLKLHDFRAAPSFHRFVDSTLDVQTASFAKRKRESCRHLRRFVVSRLHDRSSYDLPFVLPGWGYPPWPALFLWLDACEVMRKRLRVGGLRLKWRSKCRCRYLPLVRGALFGGGIRRSSEGGWNQPHRCLISSTFHARTICSYSKGHARNHRDCAHIDCDYPQPWPDRLAGAALAVFTGTVRA